MRDRRQLGRFALCFAALLPAAASAEDLPVSLSDCGGTANFLMTFYLAPANRHMATAQMAAQSARASLFRLVWLSAEEQGCEAGREAIIGTTADIAQARAEVFLAELDGGGTGSEAIAAFTEHLAACEAAIPAADWKRAEADTLPCGWK